MGEIQSSTNAVTRTATAYSYNDRGNRTSANASDTTDPTNPTPTSTTAYSWTPDDKLASVSTANASYSYNYGADGLLTSKSTNVSGSTAPPAAESYVWDQNSAVPRLLEDSTNSYLYADDSTPFAQIDKASGAIKYLYQDDLGSVVVTADGSGNQVSQYTYDAYGKTTSAKGDSSSHDVTPFAYAGEYFDKSVGLYYLRARWYDPNSGSFLSLDPLINGTGAAYSYATGNPLSFTDPLGLVSDGLQNTSDWVAGFGDESTSIFALPFWIFQGGAARGEALTHYSPTYVARAAFGANDSVNFCSDYYVWGGVGGFFASLVGGEASIASKASEKTAAKAAEEAAVKAEADALARASKNSEMRDALVQHLAARLAAEAPNTAKGLQEVLEPLARYGTNYNVSSLAELRSVEQVALHKAEYVGEKVSKDGKIIKQYRYEDGTRLQTRSDSSLGTDDKASPTFDIDFPGRKRVKVHIG